MNFKNFQYFCIEKGVDWVYSPVDRIHKVSAHWSIDNIKHRPLIFRSMTQIKSGEGLCDILIVVIDPTMDDS
jgi:hypothetical protein